MVTARQQKNKRMRAFLSACAVLAILVVAAVIWYKIPVKLLPEKIHPITGIHLKDGNTGREMTISNDAAVHFIVGELQGVYFKRDRLALGMGTSYRMDFLSGEMKIGSQLVIQTGHEVKKGIFLYTLWNDTEDLVALSVYLEKILDWDQNGEEVFPMPPQEEDFQIPDLPSNVLLEEDYPLITDQIDYYTKTDDGWLSKSISDRREIDHIIKKLSFSSLSAIAPARQSICKPALFVDFNNGTVLACSESPSYVWFGHQIDLEQDKDADILFSGEYIGPYGVGDRDLSTFLFHWIMVDEIE